MALYDGCTYRIAPLNGWKENRQETFNDDVVDLCLSIAQFGWHLHRRNNCKVIRHFFIIKNTAVGFDPTIFGDRRGVGRDTF